MSRNDAQRSLRQNGEIKQRMPWPLVALVRAYFEAWRDLAVVIERRRALETVNDSFGLYHIPSVSLIQHTTIL